MLAQTNETHALLVHSIIKEIETRNRGSNADSGQSETTSLKSAYRAIENIRRMTTEYQSMRDGMLLPFEALSKFIKDIFAERGIKITENIHLGGSGERIESDLLSAGEKQILSFLVYNAFF